jgi:hypothetical protein
MHSTLVGAPSKGKDRQYAVDVTHCTG